MDANLFDFFDDSAVREEGQIHWSPRAPYRPDDEFDLMLVPRHPEWPEQEGPRRALERIKGEPWVAQLAERKDGVWLRISDEWIEQRGAELEAGGSGEKFGDMAAD